MGLWLVLSAMLALLLLTAFPSFWEDCVSSALTGRQTIRYVRAGVNSDGVVYAVGRRGDDWRLIRGSARSREDTLTLKGLDITGVTSVGQLHVCADGGALLGTYEQQEGLRCRLYYITPDGREARLLFSALCPSGSREDVRLFGFAEEGGAVAFLLDSGDERAVYGWTAGDEGVRRLTKLTAEESEAALFALPDGSVATVDEDRLTVGDRVAELPHGMETVAGWAGADGVYLLEGGEAALWRLNLDSGRMDRLYTLSAHEGAIDLSVSRDGRIALLTDDGGLKILRDGTVEDASAMLYRARWQSVLFLALAVIGVLLAALTLSHVLRELRRLRLSLMVRYGVAAAAVLAVLTAAAARWLVIPHYAAQAEAAGESYLRTAALAAPEPVVDPLGADWDYDEALTTRAEYVYALWRAFGSPQVEETGRFDDVEPGSPYEMAVEWALAYNITAGTGENSFGPNDVLTDEQAFTFLYRAMRYIGGDRMTLIRQEDVLWRVENDGDRTALPALLLGEAFRQGAETALKTGTAFAGYTAQGGDYYAAFTRTGPDALSVLSAESAPYLAEAGHGAADTIRLLWLAAAAALVLVVAALAALSVSLRRVARGMAAVQQGSYVEMVDCGGDEVSAMAASLNTMASTMRDADVQQLRRREVYARFMPDRIADLLGAPSVETIDKQTFASRAMTTMHVSFTFDEQVYESRSRELFDNINEITECTAEIVSAKGGTILSFAHDGFDALFRPDSADPVSAAVAIRQRIIAINRERTRREQSLVRLRITLDSGEVMLGVVGDESRMQATAVSSSFNTARMLEALFSRFDANILCTESIERWADGYGSRYIGKTHDGEALIRVYEIYDGDSYLTRKGKAEAEKLFAEGIYTLYAGEYAEAKRIFMEVVRRNSGDGAARYYLYLADRFEKEPPAEVCLDCW